MNANGEGMIQFGQELRREREGRGVTIDAVCAVTKVSYRHVEALEEGRYAELPGGVFRKGIVRSYISAVGLEEEPWLRRFEATLREQKPDDAREPDWVEFAQNVRRSRSSAEQTTGLRWFGVMLMLVAIVICSVLTWKYVLSGRLPL